MKRLLILFAFVCPVLGFAQQNVRYEYMTITLESLRKEITVCKNNGTIEKISVKDEMGKDSFDTRPLLKRISENEEIGWELVNSMMDREYDDQFYYSLMRKKKE